MLPRAKPDRYAMTGLQVGIDKACPGVLFLQSERGVVYLRCEDGLWWFNPLPITTGFMDYLQLLYWHASVEG